MIFPIRIFFAKLPELKKNDNRAFGVFYDSNRPNSWNSISYPDTVRAHRLLMGVRLISFPLISGASL